MDTLDLHYEMFVSQKVEFCDQDQNFYEFSLNVKTKTKTTNIKFVKTKTHGDSDFSKLLRQKLIKSHFTPIVQKEGKVYRLTNLTRSHINGLPSSSW